MPKWDVLGGLGRILTFITTGVSFVLLFTGLAWLARICKRTHTAS